MIDDANNQVDSIMASYNMGMLTNKERYNQVIDIWGSTNNRLTELSMKRLREDQQGFNSVYMMLDSGARGSKEQIRWRPMPYHFFFLPALSGMYARCDQRLHCPSGICR